MIVAVEGPSAVGKTTWCRGTGRPFVAEHAPTGREPDGGDPEAQAAYWCDVNSGRWGEALAVEARTGPAVCDSDPLKLHYSWCLAAVGAAPRERFEAEARQARVSFAAGRLGLADLVLVGTADAARLRAQKDGDETRTRRSFDLHVQLNVPLLAWYTALDRLEPGRVVWHLPDAQAWPGHLASTAPRAARSAPELLDALLQLLPPV